MKPFLGINLSDDKKNEKVNGDEFLIQKPSDFVARSYEQSFDMTDETFEKSKTSRPLRVIRFVCGIAALILTSGIFKSTTGEENISLKQAYANAPYFFWVAGACALIWALLALVSFKKAKTVLEDDESTRTFERLESSTNAIFAELSVPTTAKDVDVLEFFYKVKGDGIKVCEKDLIKYLNPIFKAYADSENLYLVNVDGKYAFPLSSLNRIRTVKKDISIWSWNKEEDYNKGIYKQYKMKTDNYGTIHFKKHHIIDLTFNGEDWEIYFPCYELPVFEELTGLKAEQ